MSETVPSRLPVFVCYAHEDNDPKDPLGKRWLDRLLQQLSPLAIQDQVCAWSDKDIEAGQDWHQHIQQTLGNTKAAVLLVSPAFLASKYIRDSEVPFLLKNAKDRGVTIIPVILRHCLFKETKFKYPDPIHGPNELSLSTLQSANSPTTPLNSLEEHEQDRVLLSIAQTLLKIVKPSQSPQNISGNTTQLDSPLWNVPLARNPFFTGREDILGEIRQGLLSSGRAAFSGLGGIGKTQTAVEYAYRHKDDYSHILWVKAESKEALISDFGQLGSILTLPEKDAQDQQEIVNAVLRWLKKHYHWLLILDNADDLSLIQPFIQGLQTGHMLLTTRAQATGTISQVEVRKLPEQEGVAFLLRRAKLIAKGTPYETIPNNLVTQGLAIVKELDGLPLALDQAGAYIEATHCGLAGYFELYKSHGIELLKERGLLAPGHPNPVATTWILSFQKIEQANPAAAELLRFCAFLHPDAIPEELITEGASELGPALGPVAKNPVLFNKAMGEILKYSLIHRDMNTHTLEIHRLVQAVILKSLDDEAQQQWIERLVRAMKRVFSDVEFNNWSKCDRLLPQAKHCASWIITNNLQLQEGALVLNQTAFYLQKRARYAEAKPLLQCALAIREQALGPTHPDVAQSLNNLAEIYRSQGQYADAEPLYQRALAIWEQALGPTHPDVAQILNNLGLLYHHQGRYAEAEPLYQGALAIREQALGPMHPEVAQSLNNLAGLYNHQGRYAEVEPLYLRALAIYEQALGPTHPDVAISLNNLAGLYGSRKYAEAELLYQRALAIREQALGPTHPDVAMSLNNLAELYRSHGQYAEAKPLLLRALTISEQALGPTHPSVATNLNNVAELYCTQGKYAEAEPLYQRALAIHEEALGATHPDVAMSLNNLAALYYHQGEYAKAEPLLQRALTISEEVLGPNHPDVAACLNNLGELYRNQGQHNEAELLLNRALVIRENSLGPIHSDVGQSLNNLAGLYVNQGKYAKAKPLFQRALVINEQALGLEHPYTENVRRNCEVLLKKMESENT